MTTQFLRRASLPVSVGSDAIDLSQLRFRFETRQSDNQTPNTLYCRVYNLADATSQKINDEGAFVTVQAGYQGTGDYGVIFAGQVKQFKRGREDEVNTYLDILAADGDAAYNNALLHKTLEQGVTAGQQVDQVTAAMAAFNVTKGYTPPLPTTGLPRGKVLYGMARDVMREVATSTLTTWSIVNGQLTMIPVASYLPGQAVVLTSQTGMIGRPEQTVEGIRVKCLLNPNLKMGGQVKIDNASIQRFLQSAAFQAQARNAIVPPVAADGLYRIYVVEHEGDTRGQPWYSDLICIGLQDFSIPLAERGIGI